MKERRSPLINYDKVQCSACLPDVKCEDTYTGGHRTMTIMSTGRKEFCTADCTDCLEDQKKKKGQA